MNNTDTCGACGQRMALGYLAHRALCFGGKMSADEELSQLAREHGARLYLVRWLAKEDTSAYGECMGADYDRLLADDLVTAPHHPTRPIEYARVSLTEKGYALNAFLRQQDALLSDLPTKDVQS